MDHYSQLLESKKFLESKISFKPKLGIILGSGLGSITQSLKSCQNIDYSQIPNFPQVSVQGHSGILSYGNLQGVPSIILSGRTHGYEGYDQEKVVFGTRLLGLMGIKTLLVTNAAGGVNMNFKPGDLMLIRDHINLGIKNPLIGPNIKELGPRFPDMTDAYTLRLRNLILDILDNSQIQIQQGVYLAVTGPSYETPAEIKMFRSLGADAVGMSTIPEVIVASHMGIQVVGISMISNLAAGMSGHKLSHEEVTQTALQTVARMTKIIELIAPSIV